jgi:diguanylate cyclase (GGDEF)-like protein
LDRGHEPGDRVTARADLPAAIDRWLSGRSRPLLLYFAPQLEAAYERDTGTARSRLLANLVLGGTFAYLLWDATGGLSGIGLHPRLIHALVLGPPNLVAVLALRRKLHPVVRETLASVLLAVSGIALSALYTSGAWRSPAMNNTAMILTILLGALVLQLRVPYAIMTTCLLLTVHAGALIGGPPLPDVAKAQFLESTTIAAVVSLVANWRQELENRRNYLLTLKERLRREALSADNRELDDLARRDPLTGLPNRRAFDEWLASSASDGTHAHEADGPRRALSLIAVDIDHFKPFNDHYGHPAGDACLRQVAACLREQLRDHTDLVARVGGEEFAILLPGATIDDAIVIAERFRAAVADMEVPHAAAGAFGMVTISAGVATAPGMGTMQVQAMILRADAALYAAKQAGRNQVRAAEEG